MRYDAIFLSIKSFRVQIPSTLYFQRPFSKPSLRNPYDVLGLQKTCSTKDVKKAYIKLCKELHPDMRPGDISQHKKFIELNDAYTALLNSENKKHPINYRNTDFSHTHSKPGSSHTSYDSEFGKPWYEREEYQKYYRQYDKKNEFNLNHTKGNKWILAGCLVLVVIGSAMYYIAYSYAVNYRIQKVDEKSKKISENYHDTRKNALDKGTVGQLDELKRKWST